MKDLIPNNRIVVEWPHDKEMPRLGHKIDAGLLGFAVVTATQTGWSQLYPMRLVQFEVYQEVQLVKPKSKKRIKK